MKSRKAPENDEITADLLKAGGEGEGVRVRTKEGT